MARKFFVDEKDIKNNFITIYGQDFVHLTKVLRKKVGDQIEVVSKDFEYISKIEQIQKSELILKIVSKSKLIDNTLDITLFQASMKGEHMDYVIQKATELNVKTFVPFLSKFVVAKIDNKKTERFKKISQEALKQSGRNIAMDIKDVLSFEEVLSMLKTYDQIVVAYENSSCDAKSVLSSLSKNKKTALVVGSEGGFCEEEIQKLEKVGAKQISLGKNILRGETAGLTLVSIVMYEFDQFKTLWK